MHFNGRYNIFNAFKGSMSSILKTLNSLHDPFEDIHEFYSHNSTIQRPMIFRSLRSLYASPASSLTNSANAILRSTPSHRGRSRAR